MGNYIVRPGDTLTKIARLFHTTWQALWGANRHVIGPNPNRIWPTEDLTIPGTPSSPAGRLYVIQPGDDLDALAIRWHTTVAAIAALNGIKDVNDIIAGHTLRIPGSTAPQSTPASTRPSPPPSGTVVMYDDVNVSLLPAGAAAYAGYVNGRWPNASTIAARFPNAKVIGISISARQHVGDCLDIENGDAPIDEAPAWFLARVGQTATPKPWLYTSASNVNTLIAAMNQAGINRDRYFVWSAHYTGGAHICSPRSCGYPTADGTQWTNHANGRSLDQSLIANSMLPA